MIKTTGEAIRDEYTLKWKKDATEKIKSGQNSSRKRNSNISPYPFSYPSDYHNRGC